MRLWQLKVTLWLSALPSQMLGTSLKMFHRYIHCEPDGKECLNGSWYVPFEEIYVTQDTHLRMASMCVLPPSLFNPASLQKVCTHLIPRKINNCFEKHFCWSKPIDLVPYTPVMKIPKEKQIKIVQSCSFPHGLPVYHLVTHRLKRRHVQWLIMWLSVQTEAFYISPMFVVWKLVINH